MSHCIQKGHLRVYEEMRPQLREGRDEERPSRSLGRPQVPATATMQRQTPTSTAQSRRPLVAAITATEAAHPVHVEAKKAAAASVVTICIGQVLLASPYPKTCQLPRAARQKLCICMLGRGSMLTDWLGARTWDLDLPPLIWGRRRRCTRSLRRMTSSTPRTRNLNTPNFCE